MGITIPTNNVLRTYKVQINMHNDIAVMYGVQSTTMYYA